MKCRANSTHGDEATNCKSKEQITRLVGIYLNMAYKEELCALVSKTLGEEVLNRKITVYDNLALVEGHNGILAYNPQNVKVRVNKKTLSIVGKDLCVVECTVNDIVIKGNIERFEVSK